jgi:hypothetical protein
MRAIYQCETCGSYYRSQELAARCEGTILPIPKYSVGSEVPIITRYNGIKYHKILSVGVAANSINKMVADLERGQEGAERQFQVLEGRGMIGHYWSYKIGEHEQLGKDWYTEYIEESHIDRSVEEATEK